jgi:hypothetical protein
VPPYGGDLAQCAGPIGLNFIASGGNPGDTSCAVKVPPIRTVPDFVRTWAAIGPAAARDGNQAGSDGLRLAAAAAQTVGDAIARYYVTITGRDLGLRGGRWHLAATADGYVLHLERLRWTEDLAVTGPVTWNQVDGQITADVTLSAVGHSGQLTIDWNNETRNARARLSGQIDGERVAAEVMAP